MRRLFGVAARCTMRAVEVRAGWRWLACSALVAMLCGAGPARAQPVVSAAPIAPTGDDVIRHFDLVDGLPQSSVTALLATRDGFLWVGTYGGVVRFDGRHFDVYRATRTTGPGSDRILSLAEDARGQVWIGTEDGGLAVYGGGAFTRLPACGGTCRVGGIVAQAGRVLAATDQGLFAVDVETHTPTRLAGPDGLLAAVATRDGRVFVSGRRGIWQLSGDAFTSVGPNPGTERPVASLVLVDDAPWIEILDDLYRLDGSTWRPIDPTRPWPDIARVFRDLHGALWLSEGSGNFFRDDGHGLVAHAAPPFAGPIAATTLDAEGDLWLGTAAHGLYQIRAAAMHRLVDPRGGFDLPGLAVARDGDAGVYFGLNCDGVRHLAPDGTLRSWSTMDAINGGCPWSMWRDPDGGLWIGNTGGQLGWLRDRDARIERRYEWPGLGMVRTIARDADGSLWVGVDQHTFRFADGDTTRPPVPVAALEGVRLTRLVGARAGGLWALGDQGALRLVDGQVVERWGLAEGLSSRFVRALFEDDDGSLWIGSYGGGLDVVRAGHVVGLTPRNPQLEDVASCFVLDAHGALWMSGNHGLRRLARAERARAVAGDDFHVTTFGLTDGLATLEANGGTDPACIADATGRLWFAMITGFATVPPTYDPTPVASAPGPVLDRLRVGGTLIALAGRTAPVELGVDARDLELAFTAPALGTPDELQFRIRLDADEGWTFLGPQPSVVWPRVPWGTHTVEVQARFGDGAWSSSATVVLHQARPWYRHPLATVAGALVVVLLTLGTRALVRYLLARRIERQVRPHRARAEQLAKQNAAWVNASAVTR